MVLILDISNKIFYYNKKYVEGGGVCDFASCGAQKTFLNIGEEAKINPFELSALIITQSEVLKGCNPRSTHSTLV